MELYPTFIIAGAMRCGTSSLNAYLRAHPEVRVSKPKEVHFFDAHFERGLAWYSGHFEGDGESGAVGEATPDYMYDLEAPRRIAETLPDVRLLILLREPAARAHSHYWHNRSVGKEDLEFEEALEAEPERITRDAQSRADYSYVDRGRYARQLERINALFPAERVLIQTFDDLTADPVSVYRKTCAFIGVDDQFAPENLGAPVNAYVDYRSTAVRRLSKGLPKRLRNAVARINRVEAGPYEPMSRSAAEYIRRELRSDAAELHAIAGLELPWR